MPRDRRLWVKVSTDIGRHPKMAVLSDSAFRAYIEALAHAKELNRDGFIPVRDARRWMPEFNELLTNGDRPSVIEVDGGFQIRDFAAHQETSDAVDRRREASRANGAKGGRPPKPRNLEVNPDPKPESRVQSPELSTKTYMSQSLDNRASETTDSRFTSDMSARLAGQAGIKDPAMLAALIRSGTGIEVAWDHLAAIVNHLTSKSKRPVDDGQAYAIGCINRNPEEVQQFIYESGFAA